MDIQAVRTELATLAPSGMEGYDHFPGSAELPAMVVEMPERITYQGASFKQALVTIPVRVITAGNVGSEYEATLMTQVTSVAAALRSSTGTAYRALQVDEIRDFGLVTVGSSEALSATVVITVLVLN
jgi:hypothetical protein